MMEEAEREIYANAPVVLVALEVRHPATDPLASAALARVRKTLGRDAPLLRDSTMVNFSVQPGSGGPPEVTTETAPKFFSRDSFTAVTLRREATVVETTRYSGYESLRRLVGVAIQARQAAGPVDGVDRIGLRYIDEIRVPDVESGSGAASWAPWVDSSLLGPAPLGGSLGLTAGQMHGLAVFQAGPERSLVLRYGPGDGYAVSPDGELNRTTPTPGPFFLLDIDSFWTRSSETPEAALPWVLETCDRLHEPVRALFERLITDRLRDEVLRRNG